MSSKDRVRIKQLTLVRIAYSGKPLGRRWRFDLTTDGHRILFSRTISPRKPILLSMPLHRLTLAGLRLKKYPLSLGVSAILESSAKRAQGHAGISLDLLKKGPQDIRLPVLGVEPDPRRPRNQRGLFTLRFQAVDVEGSS